MAEEQPSDQTKLGEQILAARQNDDRPLSEILDETRTEQVLRVIIGPGQSMYWPSVDSKLPLKSIRFETARYYRELGEWLWVGRV